MTTAPDLPDHLLGAHDTPGHCRDADGARAHALGQCRGWIENCDTRCCSAGLAVAPGDTVVEVNDETRREWLVVEVRDGLITAECQDGSGIRGTHVPQHWLKTTPGARVCPTLCDHDCETVCHEAHQPSFKRRHDVEACESGSLPTI